MIEKLEDEVLSILILECPFGFFVQRLLHTFMDLRLDFAATKRCLAVVGLTSNMFVNKHSDFLALGFLTGVDVICTLGLLYVTPSGVDSIAASITYLFYTGGNVFRAFFTALRKVNFGLLLHTVYTI